MFIYAGALKFLDRQSFVTILEGLQVLPGVLHPFFAIGIPALELLCGVLVIVGFMTRIATASISILLILFMILLYPQFDTGATCGCFGSTGSEPIDTAFYIRDLAFLICSLTLTVQKSWNHHLSIDRLIKQRRNMT